MSYQTFSIDIFGDLQLFGCNLKGRLVDLLVLWVRWQVGVRDRPIRQPAFGFLLVPHGVMVYFLKPFWNYFAGSKSVSTRPSNLYTMTNTTLLAITSQSGKTYMVAFSQFTHIACFLQLPPAPQETKHINVLLSNAQNESKTRFLPVAHVGSFCYDQHDSGRSKSYCCTMPDASAVIVSYQLLASASDKDIDLLSYMLAVLCSQYYTPSVLLQHLFSKRLDLPLQLDSQKTSCSHIHRAIWT